VKANRSETPALERELYELLFREAADGIFVSDSKGNYVNVNPRGCKMLGYTRQEILGMNLRDLIPEEERAKNPVRMDDLLAGKTVVNERSLRCKDGSLLLVEISARLLSNGHLLGVVRDIRVRKAAEKTIATLARFPSENPNPVLRVGEDGSIQYANLASRALLREWKTTADGILPEAWKTFVAERARDGSRATVDISCEKRVFSVQFVPVAGERYVNLYGQDVTDRRQADERATKSERLFRALIEEAAEIITVIDDSGIVKLVSPSVQTILGYEPGDALGHNVMEWVHPDDIPFALETLQERKSIPGTMSNSIILRGLRKDGAWRFMEAVGTNLLSDPAIQGIVLNLRDITERKIHEREIQAEAMIAQALSKTLELQPLLEQLLEAARYAIPASEKGSLALMGGDNQLQVRAVSGYRDPGVLGFSYSSAWGYAGRAIRQCGPILIPDIQADSDLQEDADSVVIGEVRNLRSAIVVPLLVQDAVIGVLSLESNRPSAFQEQDLRLLDHFSTSAALIIERARLFEETHRTVNEFSALYESSRALAGELSVEDALKVVVESTRRLFGSTGVGMYLYDPNSQMLEVKMATHTAVQIGTRIALGEGLAGKVAQSRITMRVDDYAAWEGRSQRYDGIQFRSTMETPMVYHDELVGVLVVYESGDSERRFTESDERLFSLFAVQAAAAIQNARLFDATRRQARKTGALLSTSLALSSLELQATLQAIGEHSKSLFTADGCRIFLLEPDGETLRCVLVLLENPVAFSDLKIKLGQGVTGSVAANGEAEIVNNMLLDSRAVQVPGTDEEPEAIMFAPLKERGRTIGVISIRRVGVDRPFLPEDIELLKAFASMAASAVSNARLFEETRQRVAELETIHASGLALTRTLDPKEIGRKIIELLGQKMGWHHVTVRSYNSQTEALKLLAFNQPGIKDEADYRAVEQDFNSLVSRAGVGMSGWAVQHAQIVRSGNVGEDPRFVDTYPGLHSGLYVPMQVGGRVIGVISIESEKADAFTETDERLVATLANQAASALENARLFDAARQHVKELETINLISVALRTMTDQRELLSVVLEETLNALNARDGAIHLWSQEANHLRQVIARGWPAGLAEYSFLPGEGIIGTVFASGQSHVSREFANDPLGLAESPGKVPVNWGGACAPIRSTEQVLGILIVAVPSGRALDREEIRLLETVGEITGTALHRMRLYDDTVRQIDHLQSLRVVDRAIAGSLDRQATLNILLDQIMSQLGASAAEVLLLNPTLQTLNYAAGKGLRTKLSETTSLWVGETFAGRAVMERRIMRVEDREAVRENPAFFNFWQQEGFLNYCAAPLIAKGQIKGVLEVFQREPFTPNLEWLNFLETFADQAAIAIDNAQMFDNLQRANLELTLSYEETIEGWSRALDLRDKETEGHTQRVTEMTLHLARALGCTDEELVHIRRGALLHDIGKMGVPDNILLKTGPLTADEQEQMKKHPGFAFDVLSPIRYLKAAALDIPYCHHEKWDGSGYPRGLQDEQIPLSARIFAIADVFDALTSDRPYRLAWTREKAIEHIRSQSGSHFDPAVVKAFLEMLLMMG
jgi:PAS domain S-box-containing protein/putative nucleotidyltransferase with HDIG domain